MAPKEIAKRSDELLDLVGLAGRDRESVKRFSKGMYQRLGLAQALMHNPDLLVLDEPTDGLDPVGRNEVRKVIERLRDAGKTIFLNSHILQEVEVICTRVAILSKGEICGSGSIEELSSGSVSGRVTLDVIADEKTFNGGAASTKFREWLGLSDSADLEVAANDGIGRSHRLNAMLDSQTKIDAAVDRLRQAGVSIVRLEAQRETLEDTFMKLVSASEAAN
jgi:ABC-2 type transport system ATP-binding protein